MKKTFEQVVEELRGKPILVANRGIPARRICRSISEMFEATAIMTATDVDKTSPATSGANELLLLGEDPRAYLDLDKIIRQAKRRGVVAIHPGWGFGAEDDSFPTKCMEAGITFIGPDPEPMHLLGNKVAVRELAIEQGVPVVPGSTKAIDVEEAKELAKEIGFPVMLKAEGGGGGRGIYEVWKEEDLESAFIKGSAQAQAAFGNPRMFMERLLPSVRHIEIQVIADKWGNVFACDERDCTVQRNHQKLVEITPSPWPGMTEELRERLKEYSRRLIRNCGYHSLATVEFLVTPDGTPYLIEVNTRLQVEHGITECRYGIDIVEEQIAVSMGAELRLNDENTKPFQHAMQVRVNCEDPQNDFSPNAGRITRYVSPGGQGIRLDSCIGSGYEFPSNYDSAAALLITYGNNWPKVVKTMRRALREYHIGGVKTTISFHRSVMRHPLFERGEYDTKFLHEHHDEVMNYEDTEPEAIKLGRLIADISARGYNKYVELGEYRGPCDKRVGTFDPAIPPLPLTKKRPRINRGLKRDQIIERLREDRDSGIVHFTDVTPRDATQSNTGNRFRMAEDRLIGPYLDRCGFFSIETGGGAHFHVAMMANMTNPFNEARQWNEFAPETLKQILVRSTNLLGYKPQPRNVMRRVGKSICEDYDVIRCFDFLNHVENMRPIAEVVLGESDRVFEPALSISYAKGFDAEHYKGVTEQMLKMCGEILGCSADDAQRHVILGIKDMAGVCPPDYVENMVRTFKDRWPELCMHYHRHATDGLFAPALAAAANAGVHIVDTALGPAVRSYGQGEVMSVASHVKATYDLENRLDTDMISSCSFVLKQVMPWYDRYCGPYFQGTDYEVTTHAMPGGATSSSQEGAMKQGYIHLLPYMLKFLGGVRQIVRYHDVTPGSQITWNTSFLAITGAYKRGGEVEVRKLLTILEMVNTVDEDQLGDLEKQARLALYRDCNDAFRDLIMGKFGALPLGFPPDWVYQSAFGDKWEEALANRTEASPLETLGEVDIEAEIADLHSKLFRQPTEDELLMYLCHPGDALKCVEQLDQYGDPNNLPLDVWFEGLEKGAQATFTDPAGKPHTFLLIDVTAPDDDGMATVHYELDHEMVQYQVKVAEKVTGAAGGTEMADPSNPGHVAAPSNGDLWVTHVKPGQEIRKGEEIFNLSIMKQEKAVLAPVSGTVKRVLKSADYQTDRKMVPVKEGELIVEIELPEVCKK